MGWLKIFEEVPKPKTIIFPNFQFRKAVLENVGHDFDPFFYQRPTKFFGHAVFRGRFLFEEQKKKKELS